jgi:hypothetical protein
MDRNIVGSHVEVVGIGEPQRGQSCNKHHVCGSQLCEGSYVCFRKTRFAWRGGDKEDLLEVFHLDSGIMGCKVGYLPKHLASRADRYDGLCARIVDHLLQRSNPLRQRHKTPEIPSWRWVLRGQY